MFHVISSGFICAHLWYLHVISHISLYVMLKTAVCFERIYDSISIIVSVVF